MSLNVVRSIIFLGCCIAMLSPLRVSALAVSPAKIEIEAVEGQVKTGKIEVMNTSDDTQTYSIFTQKFIPQGEDGQQQFIESGDRNELSTWIVPEMQEFSLAPRESKIVHFEVRIPRKVAPGGHYAALFFSTQPTDQGRSVQIGTSMRVGVLFLLQVQGEVRERVRLESFTRTSDSMFAPTSFSIRLKNEGNSHVQPHGFLVIQNAFSRVVDREAFNLQGKSILPDSIRRFDVQWFGQGWEFGRYSARIEAGYGARGMFVSPIISFWVVSWRFVLVLFIFLLLLGIGLRVRYTR